MRKILSTALLGAIFTLNTCNQQNLVNSNKSRTLFQISSQQTPHRSTCQPGYIVEEVHRPYFKKNNLESMENLYFSIENPGFPDLAHYNEEETKYIIKFTRLSEEEKQTKLRKIDSFNFTNPKNPSLRDIVFLHYVEKIE